MADPKGVSSTDMKYKYKIYSYDKTPVARSLQVILGQSTTYPIGLAYDEPQEMLLQSTQ